MILMGSFTGETYKGETTWETPFHWSAAQRTKGLSRSLFGFPPWSRYAGTNVPVTGTPDHTGVRRQRDEIQHQQHNYLPRTHALAADMCGPARQSEALLRWMDACDS